MMVILFTTSCSNQGKEDSSGFRAIEVSENGRFFQYENGDPFFWLGDTGWLLFKKQNREETEIYLEDRKEKGYNVIQVMLLHDVDVANYQGDAALIDENVASPKVTEGNDPNDSIQYDYWDHVEYAVDLAAKKGLFMALVPVWGSPVSGDKVTPEEAKIYAEFLARRFANKPNIIWLNGGDVVGDRHMPVWQAIGNTLDELDDSHLITFHPRGRTMSSEWFHNESWLDFNMFQSGHRNYEQDTARDSHRFGPDNWKYVEAEYAMRPTKPTLDGEPSYEGIPHGLHDSTQLYWNDSDLRRYAYWSVFAGGAGFTYGSNAVMQFYSAKDNGDRAFSAREFWDEALQHPGASQMVHLKNLMLSKPYFNRVPDQSLVPQNGEKYEYVVATKGDGFAMMYTYTGKDFLFDPRGLEGNDFKVTWFNPRNGEFNEVGKMKKLMVFTVEPPGQPADGNDWVLIIERI
jgi:hypothetical protein